MTPEDAAEAWRVIALGCDLVPVGAVGARVERWDDVPAVSADFNLARAAIVARLSRLLEDCASA